MAFTLTSAPSPTLGAPSSSRWSTGVQPSAILAEETVQWADSAGGQSTGRCCPHWSDSTVQSQSVSRPWTRL
jgi:hypothetical protein